MVIVNDISESNGNIQQWLNSLVLSKTLPPPVKLVAHQ